MTRAIVAIGLTVAVAACASDVEFRPRTPAATFPSVERSASRVYHVPSSSCVEIGVVHAEGEKGTLIEQIAREAADNGGTHYILRKAHETESIEIEPEGFGRYRGTKHVDQEVAAIVYRCP